MMGSHITAYHPTPFKLAATHEWHFKVLGKAAFFFFCSIAVLPKVDVFEIDTRRAQHTLNLFEFGLASPCIQVLDLGKLFVE